MSICLTLHVYTYLFLYADRVPEGTNENYLIHVAIKPVAYLEPNCRN